MMTSSDIKKYANIIKLVTDSLYKVYELFYVINRNINTKYYRVYFRDYPATIHMKRFFNSPYYYKYTVYGNDDNEDHIKINMEFTDLRPRNTSYSPAFRLTILKYPLQRNYNGTTHTYK